MRRRKFITLLGGTAAGWPVLVSAQQAGHTLCIGQISSGIPQDVLSAFEQGMSELGYVDGRNIYYRKKMVAPDTKEMKEAILEMLPELDLLVAWGTASAATAKSVVSTVPVAFIGVGSPIDLGLVESLARPGRNMTGVTYEDHTVTYARRLQLLKEIVPTLSRVAVLGADPIFPFAMVALRKAATSLQVSLSPIAISSANDLNGAFDEMHRSQAEALFVVAGSLTYANNRAIAELALTNKLPSCFGFREAVAAGGLISLGPNVVELAHQGARLVDKIIRGAHPADLPVEQPSRYSKIINLKTANALGLSISPTLLASADEVME
jgi:putative tryptophan/tyrosine transport system substrate-binding protein